MEQENEIQQRWTTKRKAALVVSILKGEISTQEAAPICQHSCRLKNTGESYEIQQTHEGVGIEEGAAA